MLMMRRAEAEQRLADEQARLGRLEARLRRFLDARQLFPAELLTLADVAAEHGELSAGDADRFVDLATASFALSPEPVDRGWYAELERVSGVAADIGGVTPGSIPVPSSSRPTARAQ